MPRGDCRHRKGLDVLSTASEAAAVGSKGSSSPQPVKSPPSLNLTHRLTVRLGPLVLFVLPGTQLKESSPECGPRFKITSTSVHRLIVFADLSD